MAAPRKKKYKSDFERLEELKDKFMNRINEDKFTIKVGEFLKIIELQKQLAEDKSAEQNFWEKIEEIRQEELGDE
ncbi:MAG: hypothetical protein R3F48_15115 [Candidatus Zixiibacteriota bacterium]